MSKNLVGKIHSFETFGAVDGPGIRFIIFMQGCALRCKFCQNRDTWDVNAGKEYTVDELVSKITRYKNYFDASGGGITVSGGEPLLQAPFLIELFTELKKLGISTAIDTSGMVDITPIIQKLIDLTDLFLVDIKCINDEVCKNLVGHSNKKELDFIRYLNSINKDIWIRQVIVPTITDNEEDLYALREFINSNKNIKKVDLLKYHDLGKYKWEALNVPYELENVRTATEEDIKKVRKILNS